MLFIADPFGKVTFNKCLFLTKLTVSITSLLKGLFINIYLSKLINKKNAPFITLSLILSVTFVRYKL